MHTGNVTTPFGRRPISLALLRRQQAVDEIKAGKSVDKWKVFRDTSLAFELLGIQSNSLAVLDALLSFYPENELRQDGQLIVFPSNVQLSLRAHSMPGSTLRRHIAILVDAGLIVRRDSANGKRYAKKSNLGEVDYAFGFDLSPLLARAEELATMAQQIMADRMALKKVKEALTICRRDVRKLISAAIDEAADGDWNAIEEMFVRLVARIPRKPDLRDAASILEEMEMLKEEVLNLLEMHDKVTDASSNDAHIEQHIQNSKPDYFNELEPRSEKELGAKPSMNSERRSEPLKVFPLGMVMKACPQIADYGKNGEIASWRDLMSAAVVVRSMLGISASAYQDACEVMGPENAAVAVACILEKANMINSPGGYLRDLTRRTERGEFSIGPMVMALLNVGAKERRIAG
ncbi:MULTISPECIES: plasmid replication protein RepC [Rhizobium/Agrobacterium group]|uniref:Replication initiation protein RepC n=1 Tax=Rhizobium rhizogenes TaxID=359 RepID=A0A546X3S9_RHIRH|nr:MULTISPECIES: plasmid replication protein RepC [Rhizobium/Agrobacterium group]TRA95344.1 replication initiation protein RepC [Rhizobium rhizogenes]